MIPHQIFWFIPSGALPCRKILCPCSIKHSSDHMIGFNQWLDMLKPLGRTFKREPLFYYFCSPSARRQRLLYWSASWNEDDIEQSYSWALTDTQPKWEIYFLIESHGDLEVPYHSITLPILTDTHILIILILTLESLCQFALSSYF